MQQALDHSLLTLQPDLRSVQFTHELVRQTIYGAIPPLRCQSLHRQAGELLARRSVPDVDAVANHFYHASDPSSIAWLIRAAEQAAMLFAPETVATRCNQAIELAERLGDAPPLSAYRLRGLAHEIIGDFDTARLDHEFALDLARKQPNQRAEWQALLDLGALWASRDYERSREYLEQALQVARVIGDAPLLGHSLNRLGNWYANAEQSETAMHYQHEALEIFERLDHRPGIAATLDLLGMTYATSGYLRHSVEAYNRAIPLLRTLDARHALVIALATRAAARFGGEYGAYTSSTQHLEAVSASERLHDVNEAIQLARDIGWRAGAAFSLGLRARSTGVFGEYDCAITSGQEGIRIASDIQHRQWLTLTSCTLGSTYLDLFAIGLALEHLQRAHDLAISRFLKGIATPLLATTQIARGEYELADRCLRSMIDVPQRSTGVGARNYWFALAELKLAQGDLERAHSALDQLETLIPGLPEHRAPHTRDLRGRVLMSDNRDAEAEVELRGALSTAATFGYQPILWRIHASLHRLYLRQGRMAEAIQARQAAMRIIDELAGKLIDEELRSTFITNARSHMPNALSFSVGHSSIAPFAGLTQRETEVLRLVARGMTNIAVSEDLFISPRTVSQHLRSIYNKLEVTNRTEAARIAIERGLA